MNARDAILGRIKQSLARPSPEPHWLHEPTNFTNPPTHFDFPPDEPAALKTRLRKELAELLGEYYEPKDVADASAWFQQQGFRRLLAADSPRLLPVLEKIPGVDWIKPNQEYHSGWELADCGVTPALFVVAESATAMVAADFAGRAISVLPPTHVVVATEEDLVPSLEAGFQRIRQRYPNGLPSAMSWITGPSRTADIEKILVLGAHGPKRLAVMILPAGSLPPLQ